MKELWIYVLLKFGDVAVKQRRAQTFEGAIALTWKKAPLHKNDVAVTLLQSVEFQYNVASFNDSGEEYLLIY